MHDMLIQRPEEICHNVTVLCQKYVSEEQFSSFMDVTFSKGFKQSSL